MSGTVVAPPENSVSDPCMPYLMRVDGQLGSSEQGHFPRVSESLMRWIWQSSIFPGRVQRAKSSANTGERYGNDARGGGPAVGRKPIRNGWTSTLPRMGGLAAGPCFRHSGGPGVLHGAW